MPVKMLQCRFWIAVMFVDIDNNVSVLDRIKLTYVYDEVNDNADDEIRKVSSIATGFDVSFLDKFVTACMFTIYNILIYMFYREQKYRSAHILYIKCNTSLYITVYDV